MENNPFQGSDDNEALLVHSKNKVRIRKMVFFAQLTISLLVLLFCATMIFLRPESCESEACMVLMSGICGYWLPQPKPA